MDCLRSRAGGIMSRSRRHHAGTVLNISWASARERIVQFLVASLQDIMAQERFLRILPRTGNFIFNEKLAKPRLFSLEQKILKF